MKLFERLVYLLGSVVPTLLLAIVLIVVSADVFVRTILRQPFYIAHDLAIVAFAGVVWFGIVGAAHRGDLLGVSFFVDRLPTGLRSLARALSGLAVIVIATAVLRAAVVQVQTSRFTTFLALGWPKWIVPAGLGIAMAALLAVQIRRLVTDLRGQGRE